MPISKKATIIALDPFVSEWQLSALEKTLNALIEKGYKTFIVNNLAHISLLRGKGVHLIAGPFLYTFNKWAVSFLENLDIMALQMPFENSERNMEATFATMQERGRILLPVFAYPTLFRMRFKLPKDYTFTYFYDKEEMEFKVNSTADGSFVMPEEPFSLLDKMDSLIKKGWKRQLIDFSKTKVLKSNMRDMISIIQNHSPLSGSSRFNWKDGFYNPELIEAFKAKATKASSAKTNGKKATRNRTFK